MSKQGRMSFYGKQSDLPRRKKIEALEKIDNEGEEGDCYS